MWNWFYKDGSAKNCRLAAVGTTSAQGKRPQKGGSVTRTQALESTRRILSCSQPIQWELGATEARQPLEVIAQSWESGKHCLLFYMLLISACQSKPASLKVQVNDYESGFSLKSFTEVDLNISFKRFRRYTGLINLQFRCNLKHQVKSGFCILQIPRNQSDIQT